ncbi:metallothionein-4 isoform X1 [Trachypithecus francoisi]|uniref:metallothionein-4 isoform X1 n=1 Tax=Trachypithecus francoisi TaxID=54180 RepID=UPI00141BE6DF|nr:metallothionein-4 isoform X1 [Trachypithecus francoisi]
MGSLWLLITQPPFPSGDSTGTFRTPGPWTPGNVSACLEETACVETTANAQPATVKRVGRICASPDSFRLLSLLPAGLCQVCQGLHLQRRLRQVQLLPMKPIHHAHLFLGEKPGKCLYSA